MKQNILVSSDPMDLLNQMNGLEIKNTDIPKFTMPYWPKGVVINGYLLLLQTCCQSRGIYDRKLSFEDFVNYAQRAKLGRLNLPNGKVKRLIGYSKDSLFVNLADLYRLVNSIVTMHGLISENVLAIISVGSAVLSPGYRETYTTRRKFILFGPWIVDYRHIPIQPNDIDFLIITDRNLGYAGTWLKKSGIHLVNRGVEQMAQCIQVHDTVAMHAPREGIPIFFDERLKFLSSKIGVKSRTPRKISWSEDKCGCLTGAIN
jgi:hypothetical protein